MSRILLAGAPTGCWTNLGDEAIFEGMTRSLRAALPNAEFSVVSSNPPGFLAAHNTAAVPYGDVMALARAVDESDLVLLGGGSIFFDYWGCDPRAVLTSRHEGLSLWAGIALLAAASNKPLMVYGAGVGPIRTPDGRLLCAATLELAQATTVRDANSRQTLESLDLDVPALVTGDPALALDLPPVTLPRRPRPWLGVALRQWDVDVDPDHWEAETAAALDMFLAAYGGTAVFVPCHRGVEWPLTDDAAAAEAVKRRMARRNQTYMVDVALPWRERAAVLAGCDLVLAMRYHGALFGLAHGVPAIGLSYDPKVEDLLADWGLGSLAIRLSDVERRKLSWLLGDAQENRPRLAAQTGQAAAEMRTREKENAQQAVRLLRVAGGVTAGAVAQKTRGRATQELLDRLADDVASRPRLVSDALERLPAPPFEGAIPVEHNTTAAEPARKNERSEPRRVAILTNRLLDWETGKPCFGGAERYALELGRLLRDLGLAPTFFQLGTAAAVGDYYGFPVEPLPPGGRFSEFEHGVGDAFFRRTADYDHVLYLMPNYASGAMRDDAVVICHGVWWDHALYSGQFAFRTPKWYEHLERVFVRPRRIVTVDANSINVVRALFPDAAPRMTRIPNWVDIERFHPPARRPENDALVLFPRRAEIVRGPRLVGPILEAVPERCRFLWVGDGYPNELAILREVAARDPRLTVQTASFEQMPDIYRDAAVCVIPTVGSEGQSLACLEAMASGCAVVATHVGGLPELIQDEVTGLLCDPQPGALALAIRRLLGDADLRRRLGANARAAAECHSLGLWRDRWTSLLAELGWVTKRSVETSATQPTGPTLVASASSPDVHARPRRLSADDGEPYDIVCFSIINWEFRWQRPQQMMTTWTTRGRRVFYLRISEFLPPGGEPIAVTPLRENVWEVRLALPAGFDVYSGTPPDNFVASAVEALRRLREEFRIAWAVSVVEVASWTPLAVRAREEFGWTLLYDCMDDWKHFPGLGEKPDLMALETALVEQADLVVVSSPVIAERWAARRPDLLVVRNAADFEFFHAAAGDDPLPDVRGPIAGYFGALVPWFDTELVAHTARVRPWVTFVFVGGVFDITVDELERLPNVRLVGQQPYETMPAYLRRFDVCLVPFKVSPVTAGMDIVKFYEYISQGKPVVSTPIHSILQYEESLYLAQTPEEFVSQLDRALAEDDPIARARRMEVARENTWEQRVIQIENAIIPEARRSSETALLKHERGLRELEARRHERELETLRAEAAAERARADSALQEVFRLQTAFTQFQSSRLWRTANVYWRGRRLLGRLRRRLPLRVNARTDVPPAVTVHAAPVRDNAVDVICFPIIDWDFRFQRPQQLMSRLGAAGHRVFYLATHFRAGGPPYELKPKGDNVYEVSLRGPVVDVYRQAPGVRAVEDLFAPLDALRRELGLAGTISVVQLPFWWPLARCAWERWAWPAVYDRMDHHAGFHHRYPPELVALEEEMLRSAQLVVTSSHVLRAEASQHSRNVMLLPNACDYRHFANVRALPPRARPVVGYYGAIASWFDADLVADLAERRPDWDFLLVGSTVQGDTSSLARLPNVTLAGEQPYASLPQWLERMDVLTIPFRRTPLTEATNPVKMYEILAAGKPLVSVRLPEVEPMAPLVRLASGPTEFEREIAAALADQTTRATELASERRAFAKAETWEARVTALEPHLAAAFPRASVVIVTYNNLAMNRGCLDSIFDRTAWPNLEVHVVDNASTDGTAEWLKEAAHTYPRLNVILNTENRGFAAANNQALAQATGGFLVLLNNDTVVPRGWLAALIRHLQADRSIGLIGPVTNAVGNEAKIDAGYADVAAMPDWAAAYVRERDGETFDIPMLAMFCVAMRRDVFERIGPLDERFDVGMFEDDDYARRVRNAGLRIVCARDAFVHHWWRAAFGKIEDAEYRRIFDRNRRLFEEKWGLTWEPHRGPAQT